ncbi:hypothetical protein J6590_051991 [Homalodisca vitripennis]|nr:hypothetical protein J6590_051991 [Homalodisca vitripennis]
MQNFCGDFISGPHEAPSADVIAMARPRKSGATVSFFSRPGFNKANNSRQLRATSGGNLLRESPPRGRCRPLYFIPQPV